MCGICGIVTARDGSGALDAGRVERMRDTLVHRGPDDAGLFLDREAGVALGHRRLSIVDLSAGHQPMVSDDGSMHIVYNGEVYNHSALRATLERKGHRYRTRCDTETVLRMYQEEGQRSVEKLRGMFAFAIWNADRRELFLARDRLGVKPLYYVHTADGSLFFASEIKALIAAGAIRPELNFRALPDYLANHAPSGTETLFDGVRRLAPGHMLLWRDGKIEVRRYWDLSFAAHQDSERSDAALIGEFADRFAEAVRVRLMADVPLGVFLSGGLDSAAITATMSQLVQEPIKTFSVAFAEREANELAYARIVSAAYGTDHHEVVVSPEEFFGRLPGLIWQEDEPLAHPSSVPLHFVSMLAAEHVKVVLTGEGSDEMLAGYARYWKTLQNLRMGTSYARVSTPGVRRWVRSLLERLPAGSLRQKLLRTFLYHPADVESMFFDNFAVFGRSRQAELLTSEARARAGDLDPYAVPGAYFAGTDAEGMLNRLLYADTKTYLHELLMKQDQMSMSASIESRVPFLDHELVEWIAGLPDRMKLRGFTTKYLLRRAMEGVLPKPILSRRKMGFPVPFGSWVRGRFRPVVDELVLGQRAAERGLFNRAVARRMVAEHMAGHADHSERLWSLVNFELWQRRFLDGEEQPADHTFALEAVG
jgi:asparagine synthase (glutamine-hydrolysing)